MTYEELNNIYKDIGSVTGLSELVGDNYALQQYVLGEVMMGYPKATQDKKNRTTIESDRYFKSLSMKLWKELRVRGMFDEADKVLDYYLDAGKRMTELQFERSLREPRILKGLELGLNKTNARALSLVIEQLSSELE